MGAVSLFFGPREHATCCCGLIDTTSIKSKKMTFSPPHHMNVRRYHNLVIKATRLMENIQFYGLLPP